MATESLSLPSVSNTARAHELGRTHDDDGRQRAAVALPENDVMATSSLTADVVLPQLLGLILVAMATALLPALEATGASAPDGPPPRDQVVKPRPHPAPLGLRVAALAPAQARAHGIVGALSVVHATGKAYDSGLRVGDLIVEVDGHSVTDETAFWDAMEAAQWKPALVVLRPGQRMSIRLAPAAAAP